jgi:D-amino-acid oxidase
MKIAVIGAGIFGCTTAIYLARDGHDVHLYERHGEILREASLKNQYRMHMGFHYPRSSETVEECLSGLDSFTREYHEAMSFKGRKLYGIAKSGSKTSPEAYKRFLEKHRLVHDIVQPSARTHPWVNNCSLIVSVPESRLDPGQMVRLLDRKLRQAGVECFFDYEIQEDIRSEYDEVVVATYANTNQVLETLGCEPETFQFEVCEKPVIQLVNVSPDDGVVIMDGPFCSVDPHGSTGQHLMGHVKHAIWETSFGTTPKVPQALRDYVNRGIVPNPKLTRWPLMQEAGQFYVPVLEHAKHIGSMFVLRAVLQDRETDDARPTLVDRVAPGVVRVFSGKIPTAVTAARSVRSILDKRGGFDQRSAQQELPL